MTSLALDIRSVVWVVTKNDAVRILSPVDSFRVRHIIASLTEPSCVPRRRRGKPYLLSANNTVIKY